MKLFINQYHENTNLNKYVQIIFAATTSKVEVENDNEDFVDPLQPLKSNPVFTEAPPEWSVVIRNAVTPWNFQVSTYGTKIGKYLHTYVCTAMHGNFTLRLACEFILFRMHFS